MPQKPSNCICIYISEKPNEPKPVALEVAGAWMTKLSLWQALNLAEGIQMAVKAYRDQYMKADGAVEGSAEVSESLEKQLAALENPESNAGDIRNQCP